MKGAKFKSGDRVVCIQESTVSYPGEVGKTYVVCEDGDRLALEGVDDSVGFDNNRFRLVKSTRPETVEDLVLKANEGIRAIDRLNEEYRSNVDFKCDGAPWQLLEIVKPPTKGREYRVRVAPPFKSFYVGAWLVQLEGDALRIGCLQFSAKNALEVLRLHCKDKRCVGVVFLPDGSTKPSGATRDGIEFDGFTLSWERSDKILAALEKAGIK